MTQTSDASSWRELYGTAVERLGDRQEARWLVEEAAGGAWPALLAWAAPPSAGTRARVLEMVERRSSGEPLQYVLGQWGFRQIDLMVDRRVLIPRPETEQVVDAALAELDRMAESVRCEVRQRAPVVVDLGTGSGAIALSVAKERPGIQVWASDSSPEALDVARANLSGLGGVAATRVRVVEGHWWSALPDELRGFIDLAVSNPPYISTAEMGSLDRQVRDWEPARALEAGPTGLEDIEKILSPARRWLQATGVAVLEIAPHQAEAARDLAYRSGFPEVEVRPDLAGRPRVLVARGSR